MLICRDVVAPRPVSQPIRATTQPITSPTEVNPATSAPTAPGTESSEVRKPDEANRSTRAFATGGRPRPSHPDTSDLLATPAHLHRGTARPPPSAIGDQTVEHAIQAVGETALEPVCGVRHFRLDDDLREPRVLAAADDCWAVLALLGHPLIVGQSGSADRLVFGQLTQDVPADEREQRAYGEQ